MNMFGLAKDGISLIFYVCSCLPGNVNGNDELVLLYHSIGNSDKQNDPYKININPSMFKKHVDFLYFLKKPRVIMTFDDGFENFLDNAFPLILRHNIKAILFITTDFIDGKMSFDKYFDDKSNIRPLNWKQIREIANSGIEIGSHSIGHPNLTDIDNKAAHKEISDSKKRIEDAIGKEVRYFAYPYGSKKAFDDNLKQIVKDSGYKKAYTNIMGFNSADSDSYELKRIRIYSNDNIFRFKMKMAGAYNWVDGLLNLW